MAERVVRNEFYDQFAETVRRFAPLDDDLCERLLHALYLSYWQGWDDGSEEFGELRPGGAAGRGVIAALQAFRASAPGSREGA